ncbi:MAG: hypothetical protein IT256_03305, partial [Chitinophagaceae bacterium]|nr:hypothetical protein [Chitinophagaceae bacterium]
MKKLVALMLGMNCFVASAQNTYRSYVKDNITFREHPIDITKMVVTVKFAPEKGLVMGKVTHHFTVLQKNVDSVFFDAPDIKILSATLNNKQLKYTTTKTGLWVNPSNTLHWDEQGAITFEYEASPRRGIYFIGWDIPEN